ncbi:E3 ubiquitin-protein ligase TRIM7-like [Anolis sagrei]|uniref:E3 ubiquitin-protein ligase TRIM7-like n=1 Tax=Anolis sagrei TaxID=38937 RepID=UPI0035202281
MLRESLTRNALQVNAKERESNCIICKLDMAAAPRAQDLLRDLCEEATCPVCLDYFKDPVILDCGHNFCRACLTQTWEKSGNTETSCPQCREIVSPENLRTNLQLANFVEITKKHSPQGPKKAKGKERVCEKHQEPLNLFCKDDEAFICVVCDRSKEHVDHRKIPLGIAAQDYKVLMDLRQDDLVKKKEKFLEYKAETEKEAQNLLKQAKAKIEKTMGEITEIRQFLGEQKKHLWAQWEELEKQIVRKRDEHLVLLSREQSSLESLIQEMKEKFQQPPAELLQDARTLLQRCEEKQTSEKPVAFPSKLKWKIWEFCDLNSFLVAALKPFRVAFLDAVSPGLELQKANVTLDPDTAYPCLILSEDQKSVRYQDKCQDLPDNPQRFSNRTYVLGHEGFTSGRHFWEVVVEGNEDWAVGVARKSVTRKGPVNITSEDGIWAVGKWGGSYDATTWSSRTNFLLSEKTKRVRVCLNNASNQVAFYDADTGDQICVFSDIPFSGETVLPFFYVHEEGHLRISP